MSTSAPLLATRTAAPAKRKSAFTAADRLIVSRFSWGSTPQLIDDVRTAGGGRAWFVAQLQPGSVPDPAGDEVDSWFPYLGRTMGDLYTRSRHNIEHIGDVMDDLSRRTVARRLQSSRQVHEVMVGFWSNLLHVPLGNHAAAYARADYDQVIRTYALSTFEQLLQHAIVHPSMGINLNNNVSTRDAPNENLGRELLELHTVGVDGGYTEDDVLPSAKILTGYRVYLMKYFTAAYDPASHWTGPLTVMDFDTDNPDADGQAVTTAYLSYLARHPSTARRIARRLCVEFVRDGPSDDLVQTVTDAYTANGTAIVPTLLALVDHPDFAESTDLKVRTPQEDWQAMVRALGITLQQPTSDTSFVKAMYAEYAALGNAPYEWSSPNGYPEVDAAWSGAGRMLQSFGAHQRMVSGALGWTDAVVPPLASLVKVRRGPLQTIVDAYAVRLFGEPATPAVGAAVSALLGWPLDHVVTPTELARPWTRPGIVATLLDSAQHTYR